MQPNPRRTTLRNIISALLSVCLTFLTLACGAEDEETSAAGPSEVGTREDARSYPFTQLCRQPYSHTCEPMWTQTVTTQDDLLRVAYTASPNHCFTLFVDVYLDGALKHTTRIMAPKENSGWMDLGPVTPGSHTIGLVAHGITGGCNTGQLQSWGGTLSVNEAE
jgi:hypothetical protein